MIREAAPAKVNLFLHVLGRRPDGYHDMESLAVFADIGDVVEVEAARGFGLTVDGPFTEMLDPGEDNLVALAARRLAEHVGRPADVAIRLTKNLPIGAGLGGGSADAAATLRALEKLWSLNLSVAERAKIGLALGADVPVCLASRSAIMRGIGDIVEPAAIERAQGYPALLIYPGKPLLTRHVFGARRGAFSPRLEPVRWSDRPLIETLRATRNDLLPAARECLGEIDQVFEIINKNSEVLTSGMSGSGSACWALFETTDAAVAASRRVQQEKPNWWCRATSLARLSTSSS